jgi:hypothetical protein
MSYKLALYYVFPSEIFKTYSGSVLLREKFDGALPDRELEKLDFSGPAVRISNPWCYRRKNSDMWIKIGESEARQRYFSLMWDTTSLRNGQCEIIGLMHVFVKKDGEGRAIVRENVVEVSVENSRLASPQRRAL